MLDFSRFRVLTFDCYGTLIDWESGLLGYLRTVLGRHGIPRTDNEILQLYAELEPAVQAGPFRPYRVVLEEVLRGIGQAWGFEPAADELRGFPESIKSWQPFPDTVPALRRLASPYQLAVISNIDDDLFAATARLLEVSFAHVITAQLARSYKPALNNFKLALERIAHPPEQVLHCAESLFHDVAPARQLGLATVWINRRAGKTGAGATRGSEAQPDLTVTSLAELASLAVP